MLAWCAHILTRGDKTTFLEETYDCNACLITDAQKFEVVIDAVQKSEVVNAL